MKYKHDLPKQWVDKVSGFEEFANGAAQVTIRTKDGKVHERVLISNSSALVAMRGKKELPFAIQDIAEIYQSVEDCNPQVRDDWTFWDDWKKP